MLSPAAMRYGNKRGCAQKEIIINYLKNIQSADRRQWPVNTYWLFF